jgi:hypothetical protein
MAGYAILGYAPATAVVLLTAIAAVVWPGRLLVAVLAAEAIGLAFSWMDAANRAGEGGIAWAFAAAIAMSLMLAGSVLVIPMFLLVRRLRQR